jgi:hypothetical protein
MEEKGYRAKLYGATKFQYKDSSCIYIDGLISKDQCEKLHQSDLKGGIVNTQKEI